MIGWLAAHGRALGQALRRLRRQAFGTLLSALVIGLALALPATGLALFERLQSLAASVNTTPQVSLFLKESSGRDDRNRLERNFQADAQLASVSFVSRDTAREILARNGLADILDTLPANPLPDGFVLTLKSADPAAFQAVADRYRADAAIEHVQVDSLWVQRLDALLAFGRTVMLLLAGLLGTALVIITFNTIRLQLLTRQEEIEVSRILGATIPFIRRPYYWFGGLQAFAGGLIAWGIADGLLALMAPEVRRIAETYGAIFSLHRLDLLQVTGLLAFSTLLGLAGTGLALRRHLRAA
ncbi:MAG: ABC transporter permease [Zoogloeaceae bacterium]|nr:ABC transporter permease [Zoogloeaceae bacterium]